MTTILFLVRKLQKNDLLNKGIIFTKKINKGIGKYLSKENIAKESCLQLSSVYGIG